MIDVANEHLLTLSQAARRIPGRGGRKRIHPSCLYRWAREGVHGAVLETCVVGGTQFTSEEALQRFSEYLTAARLGPVARGPTAKRVATARKELHGHGF